MLDELVPFPNVRVPEDALIVCGETDVPVPPKIIEEEELTVVGANMPIVEPCCLQLPLTVKVSDACFKVELLSMVIPPQVKAVMDSSVAKPATVPSPMDKVPLIFHVPDGPKPQP